MGRQQSGISSVIKSVLNLGHGCVMLHIKDGIRVVDLLVIWRRVRLVSMYTVKELEKEE